MGMKHTLRLLLAWTSLAAATSGLRAQTSDEVLLHTARERVAILTSRTFAGRGYQEEGHVKAATWIAAQFRQAGLQPLRGPAGQDTSYFQRFRFTVNLIDSAALFINEKKVKPGAEFIVNPNSGKGSGSQKKVQVLGFGMPDDYKKFKGGIAVVREGLPEHILNDPELKAKYSELGHDDAKAALAIQNRAQAVIVLKKKLTGGFSRSPFERPYVEMFDSLWPGKVKTLRYEVGARFRSVHSQNVAGFIRGTEHPDSFLIISAHYDHLGMLNEAVFAGANDNASGIATLLALVDHYTQPGNEPKCSILFIAFGAEEVGLIGSRHYVEEDPLVPLAATRFILNLDLMGNGDKGITAVAGLDFPVLFDQLVAVNKELNAVPEVKGRKNAPNSDHYFFVQHGVKGFFIYTLGGPPHYHDVNDIAENLAFSRFLELRTLLITWLNRI